MVLWGCFTVNLKVQASIYHCRFFSVVVNLPSVIQGCSRHILGEEAWQSVKRYC